MPTTRQPPPALAAVAAAAAAPAAKKGGSKKKQVAVGIKSAVGKKKLLRLVTSSDSDSLRGVLSSLLAASASSELLTLDSLKSNLPAYHSVAGQVTDSCTIAHGSDDGYFSPLNEDMFLEILLCLNTKDVLNACCVAKSFCSLRANPNLWLAFDFKEEARSRAGADVLNRITSLIPSQKLTSLTLQLELWGGKNNVTSPQIVKILKNLR
jgi:hypothetical protein